LLVKSFYSRARRENIRIAVWVYNCFYNAAMGQNGPIRKQ
jgi:hypothetical protein